MRYILEIMQKLIRKDFKMAETFLDKGCLGMITPLLMEGNSGKNEVVR
jgi:hypothetical protein